MRGVSGPKYIENISSHHLHHGIGIIITVEHMRTPYGGSKDLRLMYILLMLIQL